MKIRPILGLLIFAFAGSTFAADPPKAPTDDVQDFVFFTESRPLLIRAHVQVDGKSYRTAWDEYVTRVFKFLDKDGDGVLSAKELESMPPVQFLTGNSLTGLRVALTATPDRPVANKDGKVTRDELAVFLRKNGAAPFQFQMGRTSPGQLGVKVISLDNSEPVSASAMDDAIFALLDTNKDGKLSKEELAAAPARFATKDANDDEMITPQELLPASAGPAYPLKKVVAPRDAAPSPANGPVMLVGPGEPGTALARQLLQRYAKSKTKLTAADLGMDKATFDRLDADKDGQLDAEELAHFAKRPADVELTIRIGEGSGDSAIDGTARASNSQLNKIDKGMRLELGMTRVEIRTGSEQSNMNVKVPFRLRDQFINQFKAADTDNVGYLTENKVSKNPIFRNLFKAMDADGDGMLYEKEVVAYIDKVEELHKAVQAGCVTLAFADQGNGLFDLIDKDHDGRLSLRERRGMVDLLKTLDRDGKGYISRSDIPRTFEMRIRRGPASGGDDFGGFVVVSKTGGPGRPGLPDKNAGPLWFRKMDTNRDGDVSRREFLGTDEDFKRIDTDGDGLISVDEAIAADKLMRKSAAPRR